MTPFERLYQDGTPEVQRVLRSMFDHYMREFTGTPVMFQREGVAAGIHDAVDKAVKVMRKTDKKAPRIACKPGCSACCHIPVTITRDEALLLRMAARDAGIELDRERLKTQAENADKWQGLTIEQRRCVFLNSEGRCAVYHHRPTACRKYHVLDSAALCDTEKHYGAAVPMLLTIEAEAIAQVSGIIFRSGSLPELLLEVTE